MTRIVLTTVAIAAVSLLSVTIWASVTHERWRSQVPVDDVPMRCVPKGATAIDVFNPILGPASYARFDLDAAAAARWRSVWETEWGVSAEEGPQRVTTIDVPTRQLTSIRFDKGWALWVSNGSCGAYIALAYDATTARGYVTQARR